MTPRARAYRRHQSQRAKARAVRYLRRMFSHLPEFVSPQKIGEFAQDRTPCSCWMCGNPRRFAGEPTLQELNATDRKDDWNEPAQNLK